MLARPSIHALTPLWMLNARVEGETGEEVVKYCDLKGGGGSGKELAPGIGRSGDSNDRSNEFSSTIAYVEIFNGGIISIQHRVSSKSYIRLQSCSKILQLMYIDPI